MMDDVLNWVWQGAVVAVVWFVMLLALERARAHVRYVVCWAASLFILALPALPPLWSPAASPGDFLPAPVEAIVSLPDAWWTSTLVTLAVWTLWVSIHIVRLLLAILAIRRARSRSRPVPSQVESGLAHWRRLRFEGRRAPLVLSDAVGTAAVLGWGAPMIAVAPSLVRTLHPDELDRIVIHEWAHVQRRDDQVNLLLIAVRLIAGWHPALGWITRRLHVEREIACDEIALAIAGSPKSYAECLVKLASFSGSRRAMQTAPAVFTPSGLHARVIKIVSPHPRISPLRSCSLAAAVVATLGLTTVCVSGLRLVEATGLALPFVPSRTLPPVRLSMAAPVPTLPSDKKTESAPRRTEGVSRRTDRPLVEQAPDSPNAATEPIFPATAEAARPVEAMAAAEPDAEDVVRTQVVGEPLQTLPQRPAVAAESPNSPWTAAAAGGVAIGQQWKDAGVATAGFFTRVARHVAGSF